MTKKLTNQQIADQAFAQNKDLDKVFVADGYSFSTENAANLHKNTCGKNRIKVVPFTRLEESKSSKNEKPAKPVKLDRLTLAELTQVAISKGIRAEENATKAQVIEQIEALETTNINS
jgi:PHP family Zn ribbon phosphoesterase